MLPGIDGIEVMRRLHERPGPRIAVILLTARGEESDRLVGLRHGADDYVVKPFSPAELVARVDAVLRRVSPPATEEQPPIEHGPLRIEPATPARLPRRRGAVADRARVRPARLPRRAPRPRLLARPADGSGLGRALLRRHQHRHRPRPPPARQARRRPGRAALHRDGLGRRLQVRRAVTRRAPLIAVAAFLAGAAAVAVPGQMGARPGRCWSRSPSPARRSPPALAVRLAMEERSRREIEEARRELVAAASHDLRTPLASLRLLVESIDDGVATGETRDRYLRRDPHPRRRPQRPRSTTSSSSRGSRPGTSPGRCARSSSAT